MSTIDTTSTTIESPVVMVLGLDRELHGDHPVVVDRPSTLGDLLGLGRECAQPSDLMLVHRTTGQTVRQGCSLQRCAACVLGIAHRTAVAIEMAQPQYLITPSLVGTSWPQIKIRWDTFNRYMRKTIDGWECCGHVHSNLFDVQNHMHVFARGMDITTDTVQTGAIHAGMAHYVQVDPISGWPFAYGLRPVLDTVDMSIDIAEQMIAEYLITNGSRLVHATRGFWLDQYGRPTTLKQARRSVMSEWQVREAGGTP
jgi:hypothetical protein